MDRMERVASRQNAVVKRFRELARASRSAAPDGRATPHGAGGHAGEILLDGEHLLQEALACDVPVELAAFSDRQVANVLSPLARLAKDVRAHGGRVILVSDSVLAAISPVQQPSGVVAIARARRDRRRRRLRGSAGRWSAPAAGGRAGRGAGSGQRRRHRARGRGVRRGRRRRHRRHRESVQLESAARRDGRNVPPADRGARDARRT